MTKNATWKNIVKIAILMGLIYISLFYKMERVFPNTYMQPADSGEVVQIVSFFQRFDAGLGDYTIVEELSLIFIIGGIAWIYGKLEAHNKEKKVLAVLSCIFSGLYMFAESFKELNSAGYIIGDRFVFFVSILRFGGFYIIISTVLRSILLIMQKIVSNRCENVKEFKFIALWGIILLAWLPHLIAIYPGGYCNDVQNELMQFFGYIPMSDPHPPMFTFLIGGCVWIGNLLHNPSIGLYIYILLQFLFMSIGLAYCVWFLQRRVKNKLFIILAECYFAFLPMFSHYASVVVKDAPYSVCLLLMSICSYEILEASGTTGEIRRSTVIRFAFFALGASLLKHNGIYIAIPMNLFLILYIIRQKIKGKEKLFATLVLCSSIIIFYTLTKIIYPILGIEKGMNHLIYTNMLQQTCRLALEYPQELTESDVEIISKVIDFEKIEEYYNPVTSDGIKQIVDLEAENEDVLAYSKVWFRQVIKHPFVIAEASFNVSYGFLAPVARNEENDFSIWYYSCEYEEFDFSIPTICLKMRYIYEGWMEWCVSLPFIRVLQNPAIYFWAFLFMLCLVLCKKRYQYVIAFIPGIMTSLFYVGIPAYYHHPRYAFPLIFSSILYIGIVLGILNQNGGNKIESENKSK